MGAAACSLLAKVGAGRRSITKISYSEFCRLYKISEIIFESVHPGMEVRYGRRLSSGQEMVVIKSLEKPTFFEGPHQTEREWRETTVAQLNMPKIEGVCEFFAVYETSAKYYVVMERVLGMDLNTQQMNVTQEDARQILSQVLKALAAMHDLGRIHRDLKMENVMVDMSSTKMSAKMSRENSSGSTKSVVAKLIDFDTAQNWKPTTPKATYIFGTDGYIAPEAYSGDYSPASDVYSVGVIMYTLLTGKYPFSLEMFDAMQRENWSTERIQERVKNTRVDFARSPLNSLPDAQALLKRMMAKDPRDRPSASEALDNPWFRRPASQRPAGPAAARAAAASEAAAAAAAAKAAANSPRQLGTFSRRNAQRPRPRSRAGSPQKNAAQRGSPSSPRGGTINFN